MQGKDTLAALQKSAELLPDDAEAHNNLGDILYDLGRLDEAEACYRRALQINPDYAEAHYNLGFTHKVFGRLDKAEASYRRALAINPDYVKAHVNLGAVLQDLGQLDAAVASYRRALAIEPGYVVAHYNLGFSLRALGQLDGAVASYRRALAIKPDYVEALINLGSALNDLGQFDAAVASYAQALAIKPDYAEVHSSLGAALQGLGQLDDAVASYSKALELQPHALKHAINAYLVLPVIPENLEAIIAWRERYQTGIAALMNAKGTLKEPGEVNPSSFYLAYHNCNDRKVMEALYRFFRARVEGLTATAPHVPSWQSPATSGQRIRVGFLSEFLVDHTIGKHYKGFIQHLDRSRFEVVVIHTPKSKQDSFSQNLDALADKALTLPAHLEGQQQAVAEEKLDVLFYPDIGMAPSTYFLAYARLAPIQATSWGHPDTSGLDTIDYYVSSAATEPEDAEAYYTERLIRLNRLPCYYYRAPIASTQALTREELGLPETGTLYGCPQSLFKLHPDFDAVLVAIAEGDPMGRIVLPEGKHSWTAQLKARWSRTAPILLERILFLPIMPWDRFMAVMAHMDLMLDPIHFGSGNTLYDAMINGTPVVTWPGRFARGRNVAAAYRQMGVADAPIALRLEDYAPLALALGRDPERRRALRQTSREAAERELFEDVRAVREFEIFLEAAVDAAGRGEKLPVGWRPDMTPPVSSLPAIGKP